MNPEMEVREKCVYAEDDNAKGGIQAVRTLRNRRLPIDVELLDYEWKHLLAALRRDMRVESEKGESSSQLASWHGANARRSVRLLQLLNPKGAHSLPETF